jgi:alkanesulfonate monooxygenase SsuD/methylene tetrahydromethanopterin reductase-like flavin-dependent oxidoreductase (luciferase family)
MFTPATPEQAAERLREYVDAGFQGFTFNNPLLPTAESLGLAGELIRLLRSALP